MKNIKILIAITAVLIAPDVFARNWTPESVVSYVRTYDGVTYSIGLADVSCVNSKDYFYVNNRADNKAFSAIALASLTTGKKVRISYNSDIDSTHCYVDGIWITQ